jgi:hypothetical protein
MLELKLFQNKKLGCGRVDGFLNMGYIYCKQQSRKKIKKGKEKNKERKKEKQMYKKKERTM